MPSFIKTIGTDCLDIIFDYKQRMETVEKMKLCFSEIRQISHSYEYDTELRYGISKRETNDKRTYYYHYYDNEYSSEFECETVRRDSIGKSDLIYIYTLNAIVNCKYTEEEIGEIGIFGLSNKR